MQGEFRACKTNADCAFNPQLACDNMPNGNQTFTCVRTINQPCFSFENCANGLSCSEETISCYCVNEFFLLFPLIDLAKRVRDYFHNFFLNMTWKKDIPLSYSLSLRIENRIDVFISYLFPIKPEGTFYDPALKNCIQQNDFKEYCTNSDQCANGLKCNVLADAGQAGNFFVFRFN